MSLCSNALSTEVGCFSHQHALSVTASLSKGDESPLRLEDNDDEDVDFNPFLKETASLEASSSLSSEIEGLDADVVDSGGNISEINSISMVCNLSSKITSEVEDCPIGGSELGEEEILIRGAVSPCGASEKDLGKNVPGKPEERTFVLISQLLTDTVCEKENGLTNGTDVVNHSVVGESNNTTDTRKLIMDLDDNDAICMRTRARYSLASFTLDELETFLQETDDDDDVQNVDDEEEYRKFLAAVLQGGDGDGQTVQESENVDEEDEDNDADFQIEIEEALESDLDENSRSETCKEEYQLTSRRPETRQNRRQKSSVQNQKKVLGQAKRPLRPLLPTMPNAPIAPFPALDGNYLMPETAPQCVSSTAHDGFLNGFTAHQIGQLHCLIHEHMQLLIQVYSLCVLEPSRQHVASQIQGLISEMLDKRDQVLAWRTMPYPSSCFRPPYVHPSVSYELPKMCPAQVTFESSPMSDADQGCSSADDRTPLSDNVSPSKVRYECVSNGQMSTFQTTEGIFWVPYISRSILSVLDVAPLHLVGRYMDDVSRAKQENLRRHLESTCDSRFEREPLFPLPSLPSFVEAHSQVVRAPTTSTTKTGPSSSPCNQPPKKTLAAALVESTKKQSVALVPKEIVTLAQRFLPLFNPAFYPHKPPPVPVANRVLFTEAEDELLALGLMEYNTDWKAIQQRFLPCKSKHQIFVRQKNRCSSKAPENPIKAVRRMKTSPLSAEEIALIHKGIKVFKLDWMSIWKFIVPYRDPSLLPRQWRIAHGTQKSYKSDSAKKEKRRLYESKRRRCKAALSSWQTASEKEDNQVENDGGENNCGGDNIDNEDEAYVHEAFLADWRPSTSCIVSSESPFSNLQDKTQLSGLLSKEDTHLGEQTNNNCSEESQPQNGYAQKFLNGMNSHHLHAASPLTHVTHCASYTMEQNSSVSDLTPRSSKSQFCLRPYIEL
ncbi:uncharacterized protein LOC131152795 [Malania oleifera]|uniref:uncharacterized protein LOC131152795 n=1 Tax=Malania oleifera TaxID=397392 RepID=UPI0025AE6317|nr:uncharacterized protein LOC131152795 [Malania oleifera]XP_057960643.1 uncharacterized protein LOC131152795 [Malania oleifera]XP_057960644.1 uncharacterized protein LOC131152795 [Malania oleifera]XP_057960645.1 uncharacterized protein LOC131152795 [Malania oleifera]